MRIVIIDGYTDEPSGLGVPPYLGIFPRYIAGYALQQHPDAQIIYLTIDDIRSMHRGLNKQQAQALKTQTRSSLSVYHLTEHNVADVLHKADLVYCIVGVQTPGKYLSARPATLAEMIRLTQHLSQPKILCGPVASQYGTQVQGGKKAEVITADIKKQYDVLPEHYFSNYTQLADIAIKGACVARQFPQPAMAEIEISRGCPRLVNCSFCTEPLTLSIKAHRSQEDIVAEIKALYDAGIRHFRLGRTTCNFSYMKNVASEHERLYRMIWQACPDIKVLHIDNANPAMVVTPEGQKIAQLIAQYCTEGNIASFGCETFDYDVAVKNKLNTVPDMSMKAIRIINTYGAKRGPGGLPMLLPGINLIFGLIGETKQTHAYNMQYLQQMLDEQLLIRRINIRTVVPYPGTQLYEEAGQKFLKKNQQYYFKWRNHIRQEIDTKMLQRVFPLGTHIQHVLTEIYDGNTTFGRQLATYPIVIGIPGRHALRTFTTVKVTGYMKRSLIGEIVS
ncbi:MAG: radical SAM protein [Candidatus Woesearchaeota archaeon]